MRTAHIPTQKLRRGPEGAGQLLRFRLATQTSELPRPCRGQRPVLSRNVLLLYWQDYVYNTAVMRCNRYIVKFLFSLALPVTIHLAAEGRAKASLMKKAIN